MIVNSGLSRYTYFIMRRYLVLVVVGVTLFAVSISGTIVTVAFPEIISYFDTSLIIAGWVLSIAQLTNTVAMPLAGKACDVFGRKTVFIWCTPSLPQGLSKRSRAQCRSLDIFPFCPGGRSRWISACRNSGNSGRVPGKTAAVYRPFFHHFPYR